MMNRAAKPSSWVKSHIEHLTTDAHVMDVACGSGRHTSLLLSEGFRVTAVDRDISKIAELAKQAVFAQRLTAVEADLEGAPWPFGQRFDGIIVCNYLHRALFPHLIDSLASGGILIYETFMVGNEAFGKPSNPAFLLQADELKTVCAGQLEIIAFEQGYKENPKPAFTQAICARK